MRGVASKLNVAAAEGHNPGKVKTAPVNAVASVVARRPPAAAQVAATRPAPARKPQPARAPLPHEVDIYIPPPNSRPVPQPPAPVARNVNKAAPQPRQQTASTPAPVTVKQVAARPAVNPQLRLQHAFARAVEAAPAMTAAAAGAPRVTATFKPGRGGLAANRALAPQLYKQP